MTAFVAAIEVAGAAVTWRPEDRDADPFEERTDQGSSEPDLKCGQCNQALSFNPSCPALCRASTSCSENSKQGVDGRDEPGHDETNRQFNGLGKLLNLLPAFPVRLSGIKPGLDRPGV
jgi:hypothetical protein